MTEYSYPAHGTKGVNSISYPMQFPNACYKGTFSYTSANSGLILSVACTRANWHLAFTNVLDGTLTTTVNCSIIVVGS